MDYALVGYPLSNTFRDRFERVAGSSPTYLQLGELRRLPPWTLLKKLVRLRATRLFIPLEDDGSKSFIPISYCFAALVRARTILLVKPDLECEEVSRWRAVRSLSATLGASWAGQLQVRRCHRELAAMQAAARIVVSPPSAGRVLYLRTNLSLGVKAGGSVGHVAGVVNGLVRKGYPVDFASLERPLLTDASVRFLPIPPLASYGVPYEVNLYRFQDRFLQEFAKQPATPYAFLYQRMSIGNYAGVVLSRRLKVPLVLEYNGSEVWVASNWGVRPRDQKLAALAEEMSLKHAHVVVTVSEVLREELIERGVAPQRVVAHPNCIDPEVFDPARFTAADISALRAKLGIAGDAVVAGFVGTFGQWHGVNILAEAVRRLALENPDWLRQQRVHFLIVGDGLLMSAVRQTLAGERCRPFYTLTGLVPQAEAPAYMAAADLLLSPHIGNPDGTRFFGSPTKLFEYMAMGKGIVASDLEQIGQVLRPSLPADRLPVHAPENGVPCLAILGKPGSVDDLVRGIRFLAEQPRWRQVLGDNARAEALKHYTWDRHVGAILQRLAAV